MSMEAERIARRLAQTDPNVVVRMDDGSTAYDCKYCEAYRWPHPVTATRDHAADCLWRNAVEYVEKSRQDTRDRLLGLRVRCDHEGREMGIDEIVNLLFEGKP